MENLCGKDRDAECGGEAHQSELEVYLPLDDTANVTLP